MATITYHFPAGLYPNQYNPQLIGVSVNPSFGELVDMSTASRSTTTSTDVLYRLDNGLKLKLVGTGFSFDSSGDAVGGTITSIQVLLNNGTTLVQTINGLSLSLENFQNAAAAFDNLELEAWLMNRADTINGSGGHDNLSGHFGNDVLNGNGGDDFITGGDGDDTYDGGAGYDILSFQDADDSSLATTGVNLNTATGTVTDQFGFSETFQNFEEYRGTQFADTMIGSSANETFMGLGGRDTFNGWTGTDLVRYDRDAQFGGTLGVKVDLAAGKARDGFGREDTLTSIEHVRGTDFDDSIVGNWAANFLRGFAGKDWINGGTGSDTMRGGKGNDTYTVDRFGDIVDENADGGSGIDTVRSTVSFNLGNTAAVKGSVENLVLTGTWNVNGTGNSLNNSLSGNSGNNSLNGSGGDDVINGDLGNDTLSGSVGLDTFRFNTALDEATNVDTVTDFTVADDTIQLQGSIFTAIVGTGTLSDVQFVANATGAAETAENRIIYDVNTGELFYDSDGDGGGGAVHFATLGTSLSITAADFFVV